MKILTLPKGTGKTTTLVQLMTENAALLFVAVNHKQAYNAYRMAEKVSPGIDQGRFLTALETREKIQGQLIQGSRPQLLVDELDSVVQVLLGGEVYLATRSA